MIRIIGVSSDGRDSLNSRAIKYIAESQVLFGAQRLLELFPDATARKIPIKGNVSDLVRMINEAGSQEIVILASGDPNFYGIARALMTALGKERIEIIPNVSAVQLAFARIKESWEDAAFYSVHGRGMGDLVEIVRKHRKIAVLTDRINSPSAIAEFLLLSGVRCCKAFVCENLGLPGECVSEMALEDLVGREFSDLNVLVLLRQENDADLREEWTLGIPDDEFDQQKPRKGLITKAEVRVVSLAKLGLRRDSLVWDIGAGSGSVAIEAALLASDGKVFAIERDAANVSNVMRNVEKFRAYNVNIVHGEAPAALLDLPDPDAIFIGGTGGKLKEIITTAAGRLRNGGRIVINLTTVENLAAAVATLRELGFDLDITQLGVARSKAIGSLTRLEALDPVFIVRSIKSRRT